MGEATAEARKDRKMELSDKVVLVTGASMGIGLEIARALVRERCRVVFAARSLDRLLHETEQAGRGAVPLRMDVTDEVSVGRAVAEVRERHPGSRVTSWKTSASAPSPASTARCHPRSRVATARRMAPRRCHPHDVALTREHGAGGGRWR